MKRLLLMAILLGSFSGFSHAVEIQRWERIPLALPLIVSQERIVFVDQNVRVGLPVIWSTSYAYKVPVAPCTYWPKSLLNRPACNCRT